MYNLVARKGLELLEESWPAVVEAHPTALLGLVGPTGDHDVVKMFDPSVRDNVRAFGQVQNIEPYLRCADLFVLPTSRKGMSNAILEAMASGVPCVITPHTGLSHELGTPDREYTLVPRNPSAIGRAITGHLANQELANTRAANGRAWVKTHMDLDDALDRYAQLYSEFAKVR